MLDRYLVVILDIHTCCTDSLKTTPQIGARPLCSLIWALFLCTYGDIYPMKYMVTYFRWLKFQLPQNLLLQVKSYAAHRGSYIKLLMLVLDFMVNSRLKTTRRHFCGIYGIHGMSSMKMLSKGHFLYIRVVMHTLLITSTKLLEIKYRFYGFDGDLIDINN